jgi:hypothetical protein
MEMFGGRLLLQLRMKFSKSPDRFFGSLHPVFLCQSLDYGVLFFLRTGQKLILPSE